MLWRTVSPLFWFFCQSGVVQSFVTTGGGWWPRTWTATPRRPSNTCRNAEDSTREATEAVNGDAAGNGLLLQADAKSQLFASFAALTLADQYDAVLTGLCAKILDSSDAKDETAIQALQDPLQLIEEMNEKRIPASARSLMALVDVSMSGISLSPIRCIV